MSNRRIGLMEWLRQDLSAAVEWHDKQAKRAWLDPANKAVEQAKADMAFAVLRRIDAYEAGQAPTRRIDQNGNELATAAQTVNSTVNSENVLDDESEKT